MPSFSTTVLILPSTISNSNCQTSLTPPDTQLTEVGLRPRSFCGTQPQLTRQSCVTDEEQCTQGAQQTRLPTKKCTAWTAESGGVHTAPGLRTRLWPQGRPSSESSPTLVSAISHRNAAQLPGGCSGEDSKSPGSYRHPARGVLPSLQPFSKLGPKHSTWKSCPGRVQG